MPVGGVAFGLWLSQKGKAIAESFVLRTAEQDFFVWAPRVTDESLRQRIEAYLIADEVEIADVAAEWSAGAVIWGAGAREAVAEFAGAAPVAGMFVARAGLVVFRGRFAAGDNFVCLTPNSDALLKLAQRGVVNGSREALEAERISSGLPAVPDDIGPNDLPNEGGLDTDAISYTKGCYLGQEVMARLKNLGPVRRRLMVMVGRGAAPAPHTALRQGEKQVGETRSSAPRGAGFVAMAMMSLVNFDRAQSLTLADGRLVEIQHG